MKKSGRVRIRRPRFGGWRGVSLVGLAMYCASRAVIYLPPVAVGREIPESIKALTVDSPFTVTTWGLMWACAALMLLVAAWAPKSTWALGAYLAMTSAAAAVFSLSWITRYPPDNGEWTNGLSYGGLAIAVFGLIRVDQRHARLYAALRAVEPGAEKL